MATDTRALGFRVRGPLYERRQLVEHAAAFRGYCALHEGINPAEEAYLSAFCYPPAFRRHLASTGSTRGYAGPCAAPVVWWDIDREGDLDRALADARRLASYTLDQFCSLD
jgi:hypothetical protein